MKRKIIYVSFIRLTDKVARDWYIEYLLAKGMTVEYWDVVALVRREHFERGTQDPDYLRVCRRYGEIEQMLCLPENREALYVILISYGGRFTRIFRLLSQYDCHMLFVAWGAMPHDRAINGRKIAAALASPISSAREIFYRAKAAALRKLNFVKPFDITPAILRNVRQQSGTFRDASERLFLSSIVLQCGLRQIENRPLFPFRGLPPQGWPPEPTLHQNTRHQVILEADTNHELR